MIIDPNFRLTIYVSLFALPEKHLRIKIGKYSFQFALFTMVDMHT